LTAIPAGNEPVCTTGKGCTIEVPASVGTGTCETVLASSSILLKPGGLSVACDDATHAAATASVLGAFTTCSTTGSGSGSYEFAAQGLAGGTYKMCWCKTQGDSVCRLDQQGRTFKYALGNIHIDGKLDTSRCIEANEATRTLTSVSHAL
jgi:hypothetical protein